MFDITSPEILIGGIVSVLVGIIVMVWPKIIVYVIGIWFILIGVLAILSVL
jgi:hypothetical protein